MDRKGIKEKQMGDPHNLVIMVGGASSRMKLSLEQGPHRGLMENIPHKSLIPVGKRGRPFLYYLVANALGAGYSKLFLICGEEHSAFLDLIQSSGLPSPMEVRIAVQHLAPGREKPLGTADALQQCLDQYPELLDTTFTVCNGDNLYSVGALRDLGTGRESPHALVAYAASGLDFPPGRIAKFALMDISAAGHLRRIVEKPSPRELPKYRDAQGELWVSMNIFSFYGRGIYPYLRDCPLDPVRGEKELPKAVGSLVAQAPESLICIPRSEPIPDLTDAGDIGLFKNLE